MSTPSYQAVTCPSSHLDCWTKLTINKLKNTFWWRPCFDSSVHAKKLSFRNIFPIRVIQIGHLITIYLSKSRESILLPHQSDKFMTALTEEVSFDKWRGWIQALELHSGCTSASRIQGLGNERNRTRKENHFLNPYCYLLFLNWGKVLLKKW